jgi:O-antigen/teichoic acid export membrane protein
VLKKSLLKISFVGFGNFLNAGLGLMFIAALAKSLSLEDFGRYSLITSVLVLIAKLTDFGTNSLFVAKSIKEDEHAADKFVSLKLVLLAVALPIAFAILYFFGFHNWQIILLFIGGICVYSANFALFGFFQKLERFSFVILVNAIPAIIKGILAPLIFFSFINISFIGGVAIFVLSVIPSILLYFYLPGSLKKFNLSLTGIKEVFFETLPAGVSQLIAEGWYAIANGIAKIAQGFADVGIFSLAEKISTVFSLISLSIFTVLLPKNARNKKDNLGYDFLETILLGLGIVGLSFLAIFGAKVGVPIVFGDKFSRSLILLDILIFSSAITAIHTFIENYFFVESKTHGLFYISTAKLAVFLTGAALMVPALGLLGLAYAQLTASIAALTASILFILRANKKV